MRKSERWDRVAWPGREGGKAGARGTSCTHQLRLHLYPKVKGAVEGLHNGFAGIQKAVVDQTGSRPPNSDPDLFLVQVWLWELLWSFFSVQPLSWSSLVVV